MMNAPISETARSFLILLTLAVVVTAATAIQGETSLTLLLFSMLQYFATIAPIALALGLTMIAREFDLSVGSVMGLSGCIAVIVGVSDPYLGAFLGVLCGIMIGLVQGALIQRLGLSSISVSLGTLMTAAGLAYVVTGNLTISLERPELSAALNNPIMGVLSWRSIFALGCFVLASTVFYSTRLGANLTASGSNREAARVAGVKTGTIVVWIFVISGAVCGATGVLLSYGLSVASPSGLTNILVPAISAAIVGGVSLGGGKGSPLSIGFGALTICLINAGLNALSIEPTVQQVLLAAILFAVAIASAPRTARLFRSGKATS